MSTIEIIDYEDFITLEESEIVYISISDWDIPAGVNTSIFTQAGSLIVSTDAETPAELQEPGVSDLVLTSNPAVPKKMEWKSASAGGGVIDLTNKSGTDQAAGTVVVFDKSNDAAFTTTTTLIDRRVVGVLQEDVSNNATGKVAVKGKIVTIKVQGNVSRGAWLVTSATVGRAAQYGTTRPSTGGIGIAMTEYSGGGAGTVEALIDVDLYSAYLQLQLLGSAVTASASATSISATHTLSSGSNRIAFAFVIVQSSTVTGATYGGVAMTLLGSVSNGTERLYIYYLLEAGMPANGSKTVTASLASSAACGMSVWTIQNAKQSAPSAPVSSSASASSQTANVTISVDGSFGITGAFVTSATTFTHNTGQVEVTDFQPSSGIGAMSTSYEEVLVTGTETLGSTAGGSGRFLFIATVVEPV